MYTWLVFIHILGVMGFLFSHGVSASVAFTLKRERNLERVRALLDLSRGTLGGLYGSILVLLVTGVINGFLGSWWGKGWIWLALALLIAMFTYMNLVATRYYSQVRKAVGQPYFLGTRQRPAEEPAGSQDIDALLQRGRPAELTAVGMLTLAVIAWLMVFKPF